MAVSNVNSVRMNFLGGASRIKSHLAGVKGHDIAICKNVPRDVQEEAYLAIGGPNKKLKSSSTSSDARDSKTVRVRAYLSGPERW